MAKRFNDAELSDYADFYEEHGAVRLPRLIDSAWVSKVLQVIDQAAMAYAPDLVPGKSISYGRGKGRMTIRHMWRDIPLIREFLFRPELAEPVARIARTSELRFWFDLTFIHEAHAEGEAGEGSGWHHDIAAFSWKGEKLPSLWMAMTPATAQNSRIEFIDRSHKTVPGFYRTPTSPKIEGDGLLDPPDFDSLIASGQEKVLTWDCEPGDAIIIHPYLIHGAKGNAGSVQQGRRVAITTRWLGDDVHWLPTDPRMAKFTPGVGTLPFGARPSGELFPLVWKADKRSFRT